MERILVVDDESDVREFAWDTLVARGMKSWKPEMARKRRRSGK